MMIRVDKAEVGQKIDLEADEYADPECHVCNWEGCKHPEFHFQYEVISEIERETDDCIRIDFESGFSCGFPIDHRLYAEGDCR